MTTEESPKGNEELLTLAAEVRDGLLVAWAQHRENFPEIRDRAILTVGQSVSRGVNRMTMWQIAVVPRALAVEGAPPTIGDTISKPAAKALPETTMDDSVWVIIILDDAVKGCLRMCSERGPTQNAPGGTA